jgi:hypothetical protein
VGTDGQPTVDTDGQPTRNTDAIASTDGQPSANTDENGDEISGLFHDAWNSVLYVVFIDQREWLDFDMGKEFSSRCCYYLVTRFFALLLLVIWVVIGAISAGLLWPPQVRKWIWESSKEEDSQKKTIQEIKNIVAFKDKESELEARLDSMVAKIKEDIKSKNDQIIQEMNILKEKDMNSLKMQMIQDMNSLKSMMNQLLNSNNPQVTENPIE